MGYNNFLEIVLREEGGYVNHPSDPGGETIFGITRKNYPNLELWKFVDLKKEKNSNGKLEAIDEKEIFDKSKEEIESVYKKYYIAAVDKCKSKAMQDDDDLVLGLFAFAVNAGISNMKKLDFKSYEEAKAAVLQYYRDLIARKPSLKVFERGWRNRVIRTFRR